MACLTGTAAVAALTTVDPGKLQSALEAVEASADLEPERKARLLDLYRRALANLESAAADRAQAREFAGSLDLAPAREKDFQSRLEEVQAAPAVEPGLDLGSLEQRLLNKQSELLKLRSEQAEINAAVVAERELDLSSLLAAALKQQAKSQLDMTSPIAAEYPDLAEAMRAYRSSEVERSNASVELLHQQMLSRETRLTLLGIQQRLLARQISIAEQEIGLIQDAVNVARLKQAGDVSERAKDRADELSTSSEPVSTLAQQNAALAQDIADLAARTDILLEQVKRLRADRNRMERYYDSVSQQLAIAGADRLADLGIELLELRRNLSLQQLSLPAVETIDDEITRAKLRQLRLEDRRQDFSLHQDEAASELVVQLQAEQEQLLLGSIAAHRRFIEASNQVRMESHALQVKTIEYSSLLDGRLFWIPSAAPASLAMWAGLPSELRGLFSSSQWRTVFSARSARWQGTVLRAFALFAIATALLVWRRRLVRLLERQGKYVGKVNRDRAVHTWIALALTLLLAVPGPLVFAGLAAVIPIGESFSMQLKLGLGNAAALWFLLEVFRLTCRKNGLADSHFKWSADSLATIRKNLPWFTRVLVSVALLTPLADGTAEGVVRDALSRTLFGVASVALAYFAYKVLRPASAVADSLTTRHRSWRRPLHFVVYPLAVFLPILLFGLSLYGYHFTALALQSKLFVTACLLVGTTLLYYLAMRAVSVTERRMALERILARRRAEREESSKRQAADEAAEGIPDNLEMPEYDLQTINSQMRAFLQMLVSILAAVLLWKLWSDILPALGVMNEIELWRVASESPQIPDRMVTLTDLVVVAALTFLTFFGAKNIPGSLEMSILRRMDLAPGSSYAITTVIKYAIVITGLIVVLNLIGAQWSKLQWLVAALGVGLGFGLQEIVANFVSGLLILFERPIRVGDTVTVGGHTGTVSRIRIRATTLTDWDRKEQIIPNKTFITEQLTNWSLSDAITRIIIKVGVAYGSDVELVHKILSEAVANNHRVIAEPPPAVFFVGFGDSSLDFEIRVFIQNIRDYMPLTHEMHVDIERRLREKGITIPFPQRDVWIRTAEVDPAALAGVT